MRGSLARKAFRRAAEISADLAGGNLCLSPVFGRSSKIEYDGDGESVERVCAGLSSPAASVMAQQRMAEGQSVVRGRSVARFAKTCGAGLAALILSALAACAPTVAPHG